MKIRSRENLIIISFALVLIAIIIAIIIITLTSPSPKTPSQQPVQNYPPLRITSATPQINPPVHYDPSAQQKLYEKVFNRPTLTNENITARQNILSVLGNDSGVVYQNSNVVLSYILSANIFQGEILTTDINAAKRETNIWLRSQGLTQQGICDLPLMFYLNWQVANQLKDSNIYFSPLPESCN
jgi:hypothetical protein